MKKYTIKERDLNNISDDLIQRPKAKAHGIQRCENRIIDTKNPEGELHKRYWEPYGITL